jgi:hypothetical protein
MISSFCCGMTHASVTCPEPACNLAYTECEMWNRYTALLDRLDSVPMAELVMAIRRTSPGFTRGSSSFRGVTQHKSGVHLTASSYCFLCLKSISCQVLNPCSRVSHDKVVCLAFPACGLRVYHLTCRSMGSAHRTARQ